MTNENTDDETEAESGLFDKYEVRKDAEVVENCFVLEPADDPAGRAAIKAYAAATENDRLAGDLREQYGLERSDQEEWEAHNEPFEYEPPELPADQWSSEQYQELHDRMISRRVKWFCRRCTGHGPMGSLRKARRHVEKQHGPELAQKYETPRNELDTPTDGGTDQQAHRSEDNRGLGEFTEGGGDE